MSATKTLTERFAFSGGKVRRDGAYPVISGVLLCGAESLNGRSYPASAFAGDRVKRYEGKPVYVDHSDGRGGRKFREKIGWVENVRHRADGRPVGDIGINPKHADAESVLWAAEHKPDFAGMSHVAECKTKPGANGREVVEDVVMPESVDIVVDPATTKGFYESTGRRTVPTTLREAIEGQLPKLPPERAKPVRRWLVLSEDDTGMGALMDAPVEEPLEGTDPDQAISDAFKQAMHAQIDALLDGSHTLAELISKIRELGKAHGKLTGKAAAATDAETDTDAEESRKPKWADVVKECKDAGFEPDLTDIGLLLETPLAATRAALITRLKRTTESKGAEPPVSAGRERAALTVTKESKGAAEEPAPFVWQD